MVRSHPVRDCRRSAGPVTKETPTASMRKHTSKVIAFFIPRPMYFPTRSGMLAPPFRSDNIPEK